MRSKLALSVTLSGWFLLGAYVFYEYNVYGPEVGDHFLHSADPYRIFYHILIALAPFLSTVLGYLVNERTKLLSAVKRSEERYRDLYDNAPDGYHLIGPDGTILEVNDTWLRMLGYERGEVEGRMKITDIVTEEGSGVFQKTFSVLKKEGTVSNIEYDFRKKDGSFLPVMINATAVCDKNGKFLRSRSVVRDNTLKKKNEANLKRASEEWRATFDSMPYGVMLLDSDFTILRANKYIAGVSGIPIEELRGKKCYEAIHKRDSYIDGCPLERLIKGESVEANEYYEEILGRYFMMDVTSVPDEAGIAATYVHSLVDITDIKNQEKKLESSRDAFFNMLKDVTEAHSKLKDLHLDLILAFANAIDAKSPWTKGHSERVTAYALSIAKAMGLTEGDIDTLRTAALLHDIGKIGTYDVILEKPDKLTREEFALIKMHPVKGVEILRPIKVLEHVIPAIRGHHERLDGTGYPDGLRGEAIPLLAKILCVADSFDSMTADRPYRPAPGKEYAVSELKRCRGTQFDAAVVDAFLRVT